MTAFISTFIEGLLSFLSPCVLPLVPLYMAYLAGEDDDIKTNRKVLILRTIFFVLGIFTVFCLLALSLSAVQQFLNKYKEIIGIVGAVIIIIFGLHELEIVNISILNSEVRAKIDLKLEKMNIFKAYLFGFFFAFAWTPCIGPMLTSALLLAATSSSGVICLFGYALGLTLPFLLTGIFTSFVLNAIKNYSHIFKYVIKIAGVVLLCFGCYMFYENASSIISLKENKTTVSERSTKYSYVPNNQYETSDGKTISLEDYAGEYLYLNFTATWCQYCKGELPEFNDFCKDRKCLLVMSPMVNGGSDDDIVQYAKDNNASMPILIDENGSLFSYLNIQSYPTLWIVGPDSSLLGYASGSLSSENLEEVETKAMNMYTSR